jgi:hypothetical protein
MGGAGGSDSRRQQAIEEAGSRATGGAIRLHAGDGQRMAEEETVDPENMSPKSGLRCNCVSPPDGFLPRFREKGSFGPMVCRLSYPRRRTTFITSK